MPELPEVETIARDLRQSTIINRAITDVHIFWPKILSSPSIELFKKRIIHTKIIDVQRRGKYLVISLTNGEYILIHLRMTGRLSIVPKNAPRNPHEHLCLELNHTDEVRYHDTRKFGRWTLSKNIEDVIGHLGPEPLSDDFTPKRLFEILQTTSRKLKIVLLDQTRIAGLGNIYVDEALWRARLHPEAVSNELSKKQVQALCEAIKYVLKRGIETRGTSLGKGKSNYFRLIGESGDHQHRLDVFRKTGEPCPRCGSKIVRLIVGQRSTHICPKCQHL